MAEVEVAADEDTLLRPDGNERRRNDVVPEIYRRLGPGRAHLAPTGVWPRDYSTATRTASGGCGFISRAPAYLALWLSSRSPLAAPIRTELPYVPFYAVNRP